MNNTDIPKGRDIGGLICWNFFDYRQASHREGRGAYQIFDLVGTYMVGSTYVSLENLADLVWIQMSISFIYIIYTPFDLLL